MVSRDGCLPHAGRDAHGGIQRLQSWEDVRSEVNALSFTSYMYHWGSARQLLSVRSLLDITTDASGFHSSALVGRQV